MEGYVEAHIEQYDELERKNSPLGIVEGIAGTTHMLVSMTGDLTYVCTLSEQYTFGHMNESTRVAFMPLCLCVTL